MVLTTLTILAAFGTIAIAFHRDLQSFGMTLCLGLVPVLALSVVTPPEFLTVARLRPHSSKHVVA